MSKFKDNIPGFPGYHVTKNGDVYSMKCKSGKRPEAFKLKPRLNGNGYYRIGLYKDGIKYERRLNRLVAMVYIPNPDNLPCVCHKDNNPLNNRVSNLYWGTPRDNTQQCIRDGRFPFRKKKKVDENRLIYQYNIGIPRKDILEEFRISTKLLYSILRKYNVKLRQS